MTYIYISKLITTRGVHAAGSEGQIKNDNSVAIALSLLCDNHDLYKISLQE